MSILKDISDTSKNEFIAKLAEMMDSETVDFSNADDLADLMYLACFYYVMGELETAIQLTEFVIQAEFNNDMRVWHYVEQGLSLRSSIYKIKGEKKLAQWCIDRISDALEKRKPINKKVFMRNLNGALLYYEKIESAENEKAEYDLRIMHLKELMLIREVGGGEKFSVERADKEIRENVERLKTLITEHNQPARIK